ncbi:MAG: 50S ribosomal protein L6 [Candidatus Hydrothermales bacterium]
MSKIGKKPILIPEGVTVKLENDVIKVKGPKGELSFKIHENVEVEIKDKEIRVKRKNDDKFSKAIHGTTRAIINNMVKGVTEGYTKELLVVGAGYKADLKGRELILDVGYAEPKKYIVPETIKVEVKKEGANFKIILFGINKEEVGRVAAEIRRIREPDPYKGKGIRYADEVIKLKPGKAGVAK